MSDDTLLADLERHQLIEGDVLTPWVCDLCGLPWPCDAARARDGIADRDERIRGLLDQRDELAAENERLRAWLDAQADALEGVRNLLTSGPIGQVSGERYIRADLIRAALEPPARTPSPCWAEHGVGVVGDPSAEESP